MGHNITAIILKGDFDESTAAQYDLLPVRLADNLALFHIDHYYSACWQHTLGAKGSLECFGVEGYLFPDEMALAEIVQRITGVGNAHYAIIATDWFGGVGGSCGNVFIGSKNADRSITSVNGALKYLGVERTKAMDEWDVVNLGAIRHQPDYLDKYGDLAEEYGV